MEIWKDIVGYEGKYQVSNLGNVKSLGKGNNRNSTIRILKGGIDRDGYINISLTSNKHLKYFKCHRLVAQAFIENPENKPQVNHKNGIKDDNRVENLEWVTAKENIRHSFDVLGYKTHLQTNNPCKGKFGKDNHLSKKVIQIDNWGNERIWESLSDASRELNIAVQSICNCCKGFFYKNGVKYNSNKAGGYKFKYFENDKNTRL